MTGNPPTDLLPSAGVQDQVRPGDGHPHPGPAPRNERESAAPGRPRSALDVRLLRLSPTTGRFLAGTAVIGVTVAALVIAQAWVLADTLDATVTDGTGLASLLTPLAVLLAVVVARAGVAYVQEAAAERSAAAVKAQLRAAVLAKIVHDRADPATRRAGDLATLVTRGVDALDGYFARFLPQLVLSVAVPVLVIAQIAAVDWISGLLIAVTLPLIPVFMVLVGLHTRRATDRQWHTLTVLGGHFLDVVTGLPTLKIFGRARAQAATIRDVGDRHRRATNRVLRVSFLSGFVLELAATLSVAIVAVGVGLRLLDGALSLRTALLVLILTPEAYLPIRNVGAAYHASAEGLSVADQAFAVLEMPAEVEGRRVEVPDLSEHRVEVVDVRVRPGDAAADTLPQVSLVLCPGETTVVTAPSGGGKSTLLSVLLGTRHPDSGSVRVGPVDLGELDPAAWQAVVAWLPQRPLLFTGTLADNVRFGEPDAPDREVDQALRAAGCDFVEDLPDGPQTMLGEGGAGLSAGQRQRIAVARVLLRISRRDSRLVLLDEPTAHLDGATERDLVASLASALAGRTAVIATHRPAVGVLADQVIALRPQPSQRSGDRS